VETAPDPQTEHRDVSLTIPARPEHLVLARLALSAVCRLTPLSPEEVADLKLAVTEAANDFVDETRPDEEEGRLNVSFKLEETRLMVQLDGPDTGLADAEQELGRAIIEATVDECEYAPGRTRLIKHLPARGQR
jgi:anti-sigma regulatory factor (Ser/Thr protein kinase)